MTSFFRSNLFGFLLTVGCFALFPFIACLGGN
jgi:hypothetical protein